MSEMSVMVQNQKTQIPFFLLLLLLLLEMLLSLSASEPYPTKTDPVHRVTGTAGQEALFPVTIISGKNVSRVAWVLRPKLGKPYQLADFKDGVLHPSDPTDADRLEMADPTTLRIKALRQNETGTLKIEVTYSTFEIEEFLFEIAVSAPHQKANSTEVPKSNPSPVKRERRWLVLALIPLAMIVLLLLLIACSRRKSTPEREEGNNLEQERNGYRSPERDLQTPTKDQVGGNEVRPFLRPLSSGTEEQEQAHRSSEDVKVAVDGVAPGGPQRSPGFVEGGSLPRGTEARVCRQGKRPQSLCCLRGTEICDVKERLATCVKRTGSYSFHLGTNGTARPSLQDLISYRDEDPDRKLKEQDAGMLTPLLLPPEGRIEEIMSPRD